MAASATDVARVRRLAAEPTTTTYSDSALEDIIERYPIADVEGIEPDETDWVATYDVYAAAAEVWTEKSAAVAGRFDFTADDGSFKVSQIQAQYQKQAQHYLAMGKRLGVGGGIRSVTQQAAGPFRGTLGEPWIGNQPEEEIT